MSITDYRIIGAISLNNVSPELKICETIDLDNLLWFQSEEHGNALSTGKIIFTEPPHSFSVLECLCGNMWSDGHDFKPPFR